MTTTLDIVHWCQKAFEFCHRFSGFNALSQTKAGFRQNVWQSGTQNRVPKNV